MKTTSQHFRAGLGSLCARLVQATVAVFALLLSQCAWSASVSVELTQVQNRWEARYTIKGPLGSFESINLLFPADRHANLAEVQNSHPDDLGVQITQPNPPLAGAGQAMATALAALGAGFEGTVTVSFDWLGAGSPGDQQYELLDSDFNVVSTGTVGGNANFTPSLFTGFNLVGNSLTTSITVRTSFGNQTAPVPGITPSIVSIWKWDAGANGGSGRWQFFSPQLTDAATQNLIAARGYDLLVDIGPGEGYWINAAAPIVLPTQTGRAVSFGSTEFANLPGKPWNLIAIADELTPSTFNRNVSRVAPAPGAVTPNVVSLWAWDAENLKWFFYSSLLEASGGLAAVKSLALARSYSHFEDSGKKLGIGVGFWVNVADPLP